MNGLIWLWNVSDDSYFSKSLSKINFFGKEQSVNKFIITDNGYTIYSCIHQSNAIGDENLDVEIFGLSVK